MSGEVTAGQPATDAPRMLLVFDRTQEDPIRPVQVGPRRPDPRLALQVLVGLPWHAYTLPFCAFAYGIAHVFGARTTAAPVFDRAREDFWSSRLAGDEPKPDWLEWQAWLELKHEQAELAIPFRLSDVDIALSLSPPASDAGGGTRTPKLFRAPGPKPGL